MEGALVSGAVLRSFDLRLVLKFNEREPDTFFKLFEHIADVRGWLDVDQTLMLQCVLTEAYSCIECD